MAEWVLLTGEEVINFTSADRPNPISFIGSTNDQIIASPTLVAVNDMATWTITADESVNLVTSIGLPQPISFVASTQSQLVDYPLLLVFGEQEKFVLGTSYSIIPGFRFIYTIDFASRTSFNTDKDLSFDPPQYWVGA
jgi:hypothetical protein